jgi:signal transduction histidine kinase
MIDDILDAARIEAGELSLSVRDHDLKESIAGLVAVYAHGSRRHDIELRTPESPVVVVVDPLRIEQAVGNLVSNAIKYSPAGGKIEVELRVERAEAVITVRDRGLGIPPEELPHIFEPFRRGTDVATGAGLGLSVLHRIVTAHGGRVEVESEAGRGSTFRVRLPLRAPLPDAPGAPACHTAVPRT